MNIVLLSDITNASYAIKTKAKMFGDQTCFHNAIWAITKTVGHHCFHWTFKLRTDQYFPISEFYDVSVVISPKCASPEAVICKWVKGETIKDQIRSSLLQVSSAW